MAAPRTHPEARRTRSSPTWPPPSSATWTTIGSRDSRPSSRIWKGLGGYDLKNSADRAIAFDLDGRGKLDHLVLYRPGKGTVFILERHPAGCGMGFKAVMKEGDPGSGIGGYDLKNSADRVIAFDYQSSGKLDHLVLYRPGTGTIHIKKVEQVSPFTLRISPVFTSDGRGIGGYDLKNSADRAIAFDLEGRGKLDHLVLYRPGKGTLFVVTRDPANAKGGFKDVIKEGDPGSGFGGYDLKSAADRVIAFDYESSGKLDHLVLYRPGAGTIHIKKIARVSPFTLRIDSVFTSDGTGIGGYDLKSADDRLIAFDYHRNGRLDHLAAYRAGEGVCWSLERDGGRLHPGLQDRRLAQVARCPLSRGGEVRRSEPRTPLQFRSLGSARDGHPPQRVGHPLVRSGGPLVHPNQW